MTDVLDRLHAKAAREDHDAKQRVLARGADSDVRLSPPDTLDDLSDEVDLLVLDGRNDQYLAVLGLVEPQLAPHAPVLADLGNDDPDLIAYQRHVRASGSGYVSMELPLDAGVELSVRTI